MLVAVVVVVVSVFSLNVFQASETASPSSLVLNLFLDNKQIQVQKSHRFVCERFIQKIYTQIVCAHCLGMRPTLCCNTCNVQYIFKDKETMEIEHKNNQHLVGFSVVLTQLSSKEEKEKAV